MTTYSSELYYLNEVFFVPVGPTIDDVPIRFHVVRHGEFRIIAEPDKGAEQEAAALHYISGMAAVARANHARVVVNMRNTVDGRDVPDVVRIPAALVPDGVCRLLPQRVQAAVARAFREHWGIPYELVRRATAPVH